MRTTIGAAPGSARAVSGLGRGTSRTGARARAWGGILVLLAMMAAAAPARAVVYSQYTYERVMVPMRDDVRLSVDIWRPVTPADVRVPVILTLSPYHILSKALDRGETDPPAPWGSRFVPRGYAYVVADVRGTYNSGGCWDYGGIKERQDGYDLVEWLGGVMTDGEPSPAAAWSNGRVGMIGASYDGTTANAAAIEQPPHLATIVPISAISRWWGYAYQQGARSTYSGESADIDPPSDTPADFMTVYGVVPPYDRQEAIDGWVPRFTPCDRVEQTIHGYDPEPDYDEFWVERDYLRLAERVQVPVLVAHGFLDFNVKTWEGTAWFQALPGEKMLVAGQWPHALPVYSSWVTLLDRWFERWLYEVPNGVEDEPAVRVAANTGGFREQETWGDGELLELPLEGEPVTFLDDGLLTESEMLRGIGAERYARLVVPGSEGLAIEGRAVLDLHATSDSASTHLIGIMCDVGPTGACTVISRAFLNARYADSLSSGTDLTPGEQRSFRLEFIDKDWQLAPDHHLEVIVASSSLTWVASDQARARNTIYPASSTLEVPLRAG